MLEYLLIGTIGFSLGYIITSVLLAIVDYIKYD